MRQRNWVTAFALAGGLIMSAAATRSQNVAAPQSAAGQPTQPKVLQAARDCAVQALRDDDAKHRVPFMDMGDTIAESFSYTGHNIDSAKAKTRPTFTLFKNNAFTVTVASDDGGTQSILFGNFTDNGHVVTTQRELSYEPGIPRNTQDEQLTRFHAGNLLASFQKCLTLKLS